MKILAFDTAAGACSAALWNGTAVAARRFQAMQRGHAEALLPMIDAVLAESGVRYNELGAVAVTVGPGSFTGMRVGLAAARGISLARGLPLVGVTTLEAVAFAMTQADDVPVEAQLLAAIDTRRADVYVQLFDWNADPLTEPTARMPEDIAEMLTADTVLVGGDAAGRVLPALGKVRGARLIAGAELPDASNVARLAARRIARDGVPEPSRRPGPYYIHAPQARVPDRGGRLRP